MVEVISVLRLFRRTLARPEPLLALLVLTAIAWSVPVSAQWGFEAAAFLEHIENPRRLPDSEEEDKLTTLSAAITLERETQRIETALDYRAVLYDYRDDLLGDQNRVSGSGSANWKIIEDRFNWSFSNTRSNQLIDVTQADTSENRQIIDNTSTGPAVSIPIGAASLINIDAQFSKSQYEESEFLDQDRRLYNAGLTRLLGGGLSVGFRSSFTDIAFDEADNSNYSLLSASLLAELVREQYSFAIEAGRYRSERFGVETGSPLLRASTRYQINSNLELSAEYSRSVRDLTSDLLGPGVVDQAFTDSEIEFENRFGNSDVANIYDNRRASLGLTFTTASRVVLGFRYSDNKREIIGVGRTESDDQYSLNLQLPLSQGVSFSGDARFSRIDFREQTGLQERSDLIARVIFRLNQNFSVVLSASASYQTTQT